MHFSHADYIHIVCVHSIFDNESAIETGTNDSFNIQFFKLRLFD
ncbi:MAG: hypothetical protein OEY09_07895 [Gammaproteobacteria bacterium]|nr:hypothetical protein [Gammaproteobacteria bacterium]